LGTFHRDTEPLHGITVVVETHGPLALIGRFDATTPEGIVLHDADVHDQGPGPERVRWLDQARRLGHWPRHPRLVVPTADVTTVYRLAAGAPPDPSRG
jgi:hypothetical protein